MTKIGRFIVANTDELKCRPAPFRHEWIVTDEHGEVKGQYHSQILAVNLAETLDRLEHILINKEMDTILRSKS